MQAAIAKGEPKRPTWSSCGATTMKRTRAPPNKKVAAAEINLPVDYGGSLLPKRLDLTKSEAGHASRVPPGSGAWLTARSLKRKRAELSAMRGETIRTANDEKNKAALIIKDPRPAGKGYNSQQVLRNFRNRLVNSNNPRALSRKK
jgi:hypothetical protein